MSYYLQSPNELYHHGILGMRWGIRRFQPYPKGHRGGKEVGEAAKAKTDRREGPKVDTRSTAVKVAELENKTRTKSMLSSGLGAISAMSSYIGGMAVSAVTGNPLYMAGGIAGFLSSMGATMAYQTALSNAKNLKMAEITGDVQGYRKQV